MAAESLLLRHQNGLDAKLNSGVGLVASEYCGHGAGRRTAIWVHKGPSTSSSAGANVELQMVRYVRQHINLGLDGENRGVALQ